MDGDFGVQDGVSVERLVGGDWNHGILNDFPFSWDLFFTPTDELTHFRGVGIPPTRRDIDEIFVGT